METPAADHTGAYVVLHFSPSVELISVVRRFVFDFCRQILKDEDAVSRVALATHELLENAVRYSTDGAATIRIEVSDDQKSLAVHIENRANAAHREALAALVTEMNSGDPDEHYHRMMVRNAKRTDGSGLGLARIRSEAEMDVNLEIEGDHVRIHTRTSIRPGPAGTPSTPGPEVES